MTYNSNDAYMSVMSDCSSLLHTNQLLNQTITYLRKKNAEHETRIDNLKKDIAVLEERCLVLNQTIDLLKQKENVHKIRENLDRDFTTEENRLRWEQQGRELLETCVDDMVRESRLASEKLAASEANQSKK